MLHKLLLLSAAILLPFITPAQQDTKNTQNTTSPNMDYKQVGAPMPPLGIMVYNDTTAGAATPVATSKKKAKKQKTTPQATGIGAAYQYVPASDLDNGANLLVMMFNPTCLHCEDVTFMLEKNIDVFRKSKVIFLASKLMSEYIPDFAERHHIARYPAMRIGWDSTGFIDNVFLYQTLPQINIYDAHRKLLKTYCGEVPMDTLKKFIQ